MPMSKEEFEGVKKPSIKEFDEFDSKSHYLMMESLALIADKDKRALCKDYYDTKIKLWHTVPCSPSQKYHLEKKADGIYRSTILVKHTANVMRLAQHMALQIGMTQDRIDLIVFACFFHDYAKIEGASNKNHASKGHQWAKKTLGLHLPPEEVRDVSRMILCHGGHWYKYLPGPDTIEERIVSYADFLDSRFEVKLRRGN